MKKILLSVFMYSNSVTELDRIDVNHLKAMKEDQHDKEEKNPTWEVKELEEKNFEIITSAKKTEKEIINTFIKSLQDKNINVISYEVIKQ